MNSWYIVARRQGFDPDLSARLCSAVREHDLVHDLAAVLVQQPNQRMLRNPRLPHYCAVEVRLRASEQAQAADLCPRVCEMLRSCPGLEIEPRFWSRENIAREFSSDKDFAALKAMLGMSAPIGGNGALLEEDPLDFPAEPAAHTVRPDRTQCFDRLLAWLTASGTGRLPKLAEACRALDLGDAPHDIRSVRRRLVLLGHLAVSEDGSEWAVRRSMAVPLAGDPGRLFLCGQRLPQLTTRLIRDAGAEAIAQPGSDGPSRLIVDDSAEARAVLSECTMGIQCGVLPQPLSLDGALDAEAWCRSQRFVEPPTPSAYRLEVFDGQAYRDVEGPVFDATGRVILPAGLYRTGATDQRAGVPCLFDAAGGRWLSGDWYGLRFMARRLAGPAVPAAAFDPAAALLSIPRGWDWPLAHEQALVMAAGALPLVTRDVRQYEDIPRHTVALLCERLGVALTVLESSGEQTCVTS